MKYTITVTVKGQEYSEEFEAPDRLPKAGDIYVVKYPIHTLARVCHEVGDHMRVIERTRHAPHDRRSSLGNLLIDTKFGVSVWSCFEVVVLDGSLELLEEGPSK